MLLRLQGAAVGVTPVSTVFEIKHASVLSQLDRGKTGPKGELPDAASGNSESAARYSETPDVVSGVSSA